jgi:hypothetical protein
MGEHPPASPANRGRGRGSVPSISKPGTGLPSPCVPGQLGDGDRDRGVRALPRALTIPGAAAAKLRRSASAQWGGSRRRLGFKLALIQL